MTSLRLWGSRSARKGRQEAGGDRNGCATKYQELFVWLSAKQYEPNAASEQSNCKVRLVSVSAQLIKARRDAWIYQITSILNMLRYRPKQPEHQIESSTDGSPDVKPSRYRLKCEPLQKSNNVSCQSVKFKTELCKNYSEKGSCPYRVKCRYAHGYEELLQDPPAKKAYRTKRCQSFWTKGLCPYGRRCQFSHYEVTESTKLYLRIVRDVLTIGDSFAEETPSWLL